MRRASYQEQADQAIFRWQSGSYMVRSDIQALLENAAIAEGSDPAHLGTHSLRIGGASALWAMYKDSALVRRWGRWSSDCFHGYLWENREGARELSAQMASADMDLV